MIALGVLAVLGAAGLTAAVVDIGGGGQDSSEDDQYDDAQPSAYTKDTGDTGDVSQASGIDDTDLDDKLINFNDVTDVTVVDRPLDPEDVPTSDDDDLSLDDGDQPSDDDDPFFDDDSNSDDDYYAEFSLPPTEGDDYLAPDPAVELAEPINLLGGNDTAFFVGMSGGLSTQTEINGGEGSDSITLTNCSNLSVDGGEDNDSIFIDYGTNISVDGGSGNDDFFVTTQINPTDIQDATDIPQFTLGEGFDSFNASVVSFVADKDHGANVDDDGHAVTRSFQIMDFDPNEDMLEISINPYELAEFPAIHDVTYQQVELADASGYQTNVKVVFEQMADADPDALTAAMEFTIFSNAAFDLQNSVIGDDNDGIYQSMLTAGVGAATFS